MLIELIIIVPVGLLCLCFGILIWKKEKISLIHSYHYTKVKEKDKKAYTNLMGKGVCLIGVGCLLTGIIDIITQTAYGWISFIIFFIIGLLVIVKAQKKYNGGLF